MSTQRRTLVLILAMLALGLGIFAFNSGGLVGVAMAQGPRGGKSPSAAVGTGFTYQGQLKQNGALVTGSCDLQFGLWDGAASGPQYGTTQTVSSLPVTNGLFTTLLDFGITAPNNVFTGTARYLASAVRCPAGGGSYTALSPRQQLTPAPYALALPGLYTTQNITSPNVIGGYSGNVISNTVVGATISGGGGISDIFGDPCPLCYNSISAIYGTIGGGYSNTVSGKNAFIAGGHSNTASGVLATVGGMANTATGDYTTIAGGGINTASGFNAAIGGGQNNTASGSEATIGGGERNTASGIYSTVPGGRYAVASHPGEMAYANGKFAANGDAQTSTYVVRNTTTDATQTELYLDGMSQRITVALSRTMTFDVLVVGRRDSGNESFGATISGVIKNDGGTTALVGSVNKTGEWTNDFVYPWSATASADAANNALRIQVIGAPGKTIRWVATVRTVEVAW